MRNFSRLWKKIKNLNFFAIFKDNTFSIVHTKFHNTSSLTLAAKHKIMPKKIKVWSLKLIKNMRVIPCQVEQGCNCPSQIFMKCCWNVVSSAGRCPVNFFIKILSRFCFNGDWSLSKNRTLRHAASGFFFLPISFSLKN